MKSPIARRRERRILDILSHCGTQTESDLRSLLLVSERSTTKALLNLAIAGLITCESRYNDLLALRYRTWKLTEQEETTSD